jgi:hypothetical protein
VGLATAQAGNGQFSATENCYAALNYGRQIEYICGVFAFTTDGNRETANPTLIADVDGSLANMLHLIVSPAGWTLTIRINNGDFVEIGRGVHNLATNGAGYEVGMLINKAAGTVVVTGPDGARTTITEAQISTLDLRTGVWQIRQTAGSSTAVWRSAAMGPRPSLAASRVPLAGAADVRDLVPFKGFGITNRQIWRGVPDAATGWFRVVNRASWRTFTIVGRLSISGTDANSAQLSVIDVNGVWNIATPTLTQVLHRHYTGQMITQVRISRDAGSPNIALDINIATNHASRLLSLEWEGVGVLLGKPIASATALPTETVTLNLA